MPDWICAAGGTLLVPSGPKGKHLHVVLNNPKDFKGYQPQSCLSVSICTVRAGPFDDTVVIEPASDTHPFIKNRSYVSYRHARIDPAEKLQELVRVMLFTPMENVSQELFERIRVGVQNSRQSPRFIKELDLS